MTPIFMIPLGPDGDPLLSQCSVCGEWREYTVSFLTWRTEVIMCNLCIRAAGVLLVETFGETEASRA